jgi:hypothetical protein
MWDVRCEMWDLGIEEFGDFMEHGEKARKAGNELEDSWQEAAGSNAQLS